MRSRKGLMPESAVLVVLSVMFLMSVLGAYVKAHEVFSANPVDKASYAISRYGESEKIPDADLAELEAFLLEDFSEEDFSDDGVDREHFFSEVDWNLNAGDTAYFEDAVVHRVDGPAIIRADGVEEYWLFGLKIRSYEDFLKNLPDEGDYDKGLQLVYHDGAVVLRNDILSKWSNSVNRLDAFGLPHADGMPAFSADGFEAWYQFGLLHRNDGPALTFPDGTQAWFTYGLLNRTDGPAIEYGKLPDSWHVSWGMFHRVDGPALELDHKHFVEGDQITEDEFWTSAEPLPHIQKDDSVEWRADGILHRIDGPAVERWDGQDEFWFKGELLWQTEKSLSEALEPYQCSNPNYYPTSVGPIPLYE